MQRHVGLLQAVAIGVGGTIGGGIFTLIGVAAAEAGPAALLSFVLACSAAFLLGLCYAELSSRFPHTGGGYVFVREAFGPAAGFLMGWGYWGGYLVVSGYVTLGFGGYLEQMTGLPRVPAAVGLVVALAVLNLLGVRISSRLQALVVMLGVTSLLALAVVGSWRASPALLHPFLPRGWSGLLEASLAAFLAFGGFDQVAALGDEVQEPRRTLPRAILLSLATVLLLYLGLLYTCMGNVPWQQLGASPAPVALAAARVLGPSASAGVPVFAVLMTTATANALVLVTSRVLFAMARDGLVPMVLARVAGRQQVPVTAVLASAAGMALVALGGNLPFVVDAAGFLYTWGFLLTLAAYFRFRHTCGPAAPFIVPAYPLVPMLACVLTLIVLVQAGGTATMTGLGWLAAGGAFYVLMRRYQLGGDRSGT